MAIGYGKINNVMVRTYASLLQIELPNIRSAGAMSLDIGEDRILLDTRSKVYYMDIYLPYNLVQPECGAQFDKRTKILTVTMPVQPKASV